MKVLYLTNLPAPYKIAFFNELSKKCDLTVLFDGLDRDKREGTWYKNNILNFKNDILGEFDFKKIKNYLNEDFDIVVNAKYASKYGAYLSLYMSKKHKPFFISADGGLINYNDNFLSKGLKNIFLSKATYYLSSGKETNKYLEYYGAKRDKIYTYNFTSLYKKDILDKPIDYKEKLCLRNNKNLNYKKIFISVGSLIERKGYDVLLKSLKDNMFVDALFIIVGSGDKKNGLDVYIKENKINNVRLLGFMDKQHVFEYYKLSDAFILPSREDVWGLVINEAMANGLPVISSNNVVAAKELINDKYLYNYENEIELNSLIKDFYNLSNEELYKIGSENLKKIQNYTIENMASRHLEIFKEVLKNEKE